MIRIASDSAYDEDVIVSGGGPAGAAAAAYLARAGIRVLVLDRQTFPRDKVCGDYVGPAALLELRRLGVSQLPNYHRTNVARRAALYLGGRELVSRPFPDIEGLPSYGRVIPRIVLDRWILDAARRAGARVLDGVGLTSYAVDDGCVTVQVRSSSGVCTFRTRVLIGADGSGSTVARLMRGSAPPRGDRIIAIRAYYEEVEGPEDTLDLYFTSESFPGYGWLFPTGGGSANVGLGLALETIPEHEETLRPILLRLMESDRALKRRLGTARLVGKISGWPLMTYDPRLPIVGDGVILIGDAAGLINPLNGEGIQYALLSGGWAAETVKNCLARDDFSARALATYANRVEQELRYDMALARLIMQFITNRALNPIWLRALEIIAARAKVDTSYERIAGGILAGLVPAREALSARIIGATLEQAAVSLGLSATLTALRGPVGWAGAGLDAAQIGFRLAYDAASDPTGFATWVYRVADSAFELAGQAGRDALTTLVPFADTSVRVVT